MKLRDLIKMNSINDGTRSLMESMAIPEVAEALKSWNFDSKNSILIGGLAVGYYSRPRATTDVDILFTNASYIPVVMSNFKKIRTGSFQHNKTHVEIEVISPQSINITKELCDKVFETSIIIDGVRIASPSGLVALKLSRLKRYDEGDIIALIETGRVDMLGWPITKEQLKKFEEIKLKV